MRDFIKKYDIEDYFEKLPDANKRVLLESAWEQQVWSIAKQHHLLLDETDLVVQQTGLVLLGVKPGNQLHRNLTEKAGLLDSEANAIVREINAIIFIPMRQKIQELLKHPTEEDLLTAIEDGAAKQPQETIAHKKLSEIFSLSPATSDHSVEIPAKPTSYTDGADPYHEPID